MSRSTTRLTSARSRVGLWWVLGVGMMALAVVSGIGQLRDDPTGADAPRPYEPSSAPPSHAPTPAKVSADSAPASLPVGLDIPAIGVSTDLIRLGLNDDNTVQVPEDAAKAGWYEHGPAPGQPGSAVILGHVDSAEGPAVFFRLRFLTPGDRLEARLADGTTAFFRVTRVATYANEDFPARRVYAGGRERPALNLVTCGGVYDRDRGGYQSNVVVFSEFLRTAPAI